MDVKGQEPPIKGGSRYWPHAAFAELLFDWGALDSPNLKDDLEFLYSQRIKADYYEESISDGEALEVLSIAESIVENLECE